MMDLSLESTERRRECPTIGLSRSRIVELHNRLFVFAPVIAGSGIKIGEDADARSNSPESISQRGTFRSGTFFSEARACGRRVRAHASHFAAQPRFTDR